MNIIFTVIILLSVSALLTYLAPKLKIPKVVVLIFLGLLLSNQFLKNFIISDNSETIFVLGDIALISLMFLAGLETSWKALFQEKKDSLIIACFAAFLPFILATISMLLLKFSLTTSLITGICLSITAESTKARVLLELKKLKTRVGAAMMGAGIIDDFLGLIFFMIITWTLHKDFTQTNIILILTILAFFVGILAQKYLGRHHTVVSYTEKTLLILIVPFVFIAMGMHFELSSLFVNPLILLVILIIAFLGKIIGSLLSKPLTTFSYKQLYLIGWAMNSRGAIGLALALIAIKAELITNEIYSSLIISALAATLIFPFVITRLIKKSPKIMS